MGDAAALPPGKLPGDLLSRLVAKYPVADERVVIGPGIGRDSAAITFGNETLVVKTDPITFASDRAAHYLVHVNANDIACQGGTPRWLLVTALLPERETTPAAVETMFRELNLAAAEIGVSVIGGHTEITVGLDRPILIGTMLGIAQYGRLISPIHAKPGDRLLMTKSAGIEGTALLATEYRARLAIIDEATLNRAANFLTDPGISILAEASALNLAGAVTALHDPTEGGVATAVRELSESTDCGAVVSKSSVTVAAETSRICEALALDPLGLLSSGSLLAVVPADRIELATEALNVTGIPYSWIGKLTPPEAGIQMRIDDHFVDLPQFPVDEVARFMAGADGE
jgi:hydrogenase maturation factor